MGVYNILIESIRRLYKIGRINEQKIVELFEDKKITEEEKLYILNVNLDVE